jgi:hypothetical protein
MSEMDRDPGIAHRVVRYGHPWDESVLADAPPASLRPREKSPGPSTPRGRVPFFELTDRERRAFLQPVLVSGAWALIFSSGFQDWGNPLIYLGWAVIAGSFIAAAR